jgi:hypothetical protein
MCGNAGFTCLRRATPGGAELIRTSRCTPPPESLPSAGLSNETWIACVKFVTQP